MTSWKPDFAPYLEIQYDLNLNESGYKEGIATVFNKVLAVTPFFQNTSGLPAGVVGALGANWSGGKYDVYLNTSNAIVQASCDFGAIIYGLR